MSFGENLKEYRKSKGLTQLQLGQKLNLAESTISLYESNKRFPDQETLLKISKFFNVSTDYLLGFDHLKEIKNTISVAISDDPELLSFWEELQEREDLKLLFKQTKTLSPSTIKRVIKYIKLVEDEESKED